MSGVSGQTMMFSMRSKALATRDAASTAVAAAQGAVRQTLGVGVVKDKTEPDSASMKLPLMSDAEDEQEPSVVVPAASTVKDKFVTAVGTMKHKCDAAAAGAVLQMASAGSAVKLSASTVKDKCDAAAYGAFDIGKVSQQLPSSGKVANTVMYGQFANSECVEQLVAMGFHRRDAVHAVRESGSKDVGAIATFLLAKIEARGASLTWKQHRVIERLVEMGFKRKDVISIVRRVGSHDVNAISAFLVQMHDTTASALTWEEHVAKRIADIERVETEELNFALRLSAFLADAGHPLPEVASMQQPASKPQPTPAAHLKPSVGTWLIPLRKSGNAGAQGTGEVTHTVNNSDALLASSFALGWEIADESSKAPDPDGFTSSRKGAVRCGA